MTRPNTPSAVALDTQLALLAAMRLLPLARESATAFRPLAPAAAAYRARFPALGDGAVDLAAEFPFLAEFLRDAESFWQRGETGTLKSGPWTQPDANGRACVLEATAVVSDQEAGPGPVLLLELLGDEFAELQAVMQNARQQRLDYEQLRKMHAALAESARQLHRMTEERGTAIAMLRAAREQLEDRVAERTVALGESNRQLQAEIAEKGRINDELLTHQQQLRTLTEQLATAEEQQRRQIAEFLHDRIGQSLAVAKMRLRAMRGTAPAAGEQLDELDRLVDEVITDTRGLTADLGTPALYEFGLGEALDGLVRRFEQVHGIQARFEDHARGRPLGDNERLFLYQTARELLHNVVKHAEAASVAVELRRDGDQVAISVADSGLGFDTGSFHFRVTAAGGFGLFHIRERALHLGGQCRVRSAPGQGTEIVVSVPAAAHATSESP
jgi:signal transduction histidine kinase